MKRHGFALVMWGIIMLYILGNALHEELTIEIAIAIILISLIFMYLIGSDEDPRLKCEHNYKCIDTPDSKLEELIGDPLALTKGTGYIKNYECKICGLKKTKVTRIPF